MQGTLQTEAGIETLRAGTSSISRGVKPHATTAHPATPLKLEASGRGALVPMPLLTGRSSANRGCDTHRLTMPGMLFVAVVLAACTSLASPTSTSIASPLTCPAAMTASSPAGATGALPAGFALLSSETSRLAATATIASAPWTAAELITAATLSATASPLHAVTASAVAQGRHADPELEALLPATLGGVSLTIESQAGTDLATESAAFDAFLASLDKTRADFSLASAYSPGGLEAKVGAWRVKGADPALLLPGFKTAVQASSTTPLTQVEEIVGGRAVTRIGDPGQLTQGPLYVFVRGDTLLFVQTTEPALAEEATSCRSNALGASPALASRRPLHHSSALTMNPASTSSVADVT
jgi:hypothetical protein